MAAFDCPACKWSGHPVFDFNKFGKLVAKCAATGCDYIDPSRGPEHFSTAMIRTEPGSGAPGSGAMVSADLDPSSAALNVAAPSQGQPQAPRPIAAPATQRQALAQAHAFTSAPLDVIGQIKARRDFLESECARADGYRVELRKLNKMLRVALREEASIVMPKSIGDA